MRNRNYIILNRAAIAIGLFIALAGCERDLSDEATFATFPTQPDIYTDNPIGLTDEFFISFDPSVGANTDAFDVDNSEAYEGSSSIRIDVPAANDPNGTFVGGIFLDRGAGRNLTGYDALTFWAKGSVTTTVGLVGFGTDFEENKYPVARNNIQLSTTWKKYIVPIPDPSKLTQERGMFIFSAGTEDNNGVGYVLWIDELRFENLGTIAQLRPSIFGGEDLVEQGFTGSVREVTGLSSKFNGPSGGDITVAPGPRYYDFSSSNTSVAFVNQLGLIEIIGEGTTTITAQLNGVLAEGSLEITSEGPFESAPTPTRPESSVISIFSDAYPNIPVDYYNGFFTPDGQTTLGGATPVGPNESIISYTDLNFVGIGFFNDVPSVNATAMTHLHVDINVREAINSGDFIRLQLLNSVANNESSGVFTINGTDLESEDWVGFDIPLSDFAGLSDRSQLGLLFFISDTTISNIFVDNIYFYQE
jgi:hypothetical protein